MGYYRHQMMVRSRIREKWIKAIEAGATVSVNMILYDLDNTKLEYSRKSVLEYLDRMCEVEGYKYDGEIIKLK